MVAHGPLHGGTGLGRGIKVFISQLLNQDPPANVSRHFSLGFSLLQSPFSSTRPLSGLRALQTLHSLSTEAIGTPEGALYFHLN